MKTSRRSLFGMLAAAPVAIPEMAKAFKESPELPSSATEAINNLPFPNREEALISQGMYTCYGGGFTVRYNLDEDDVIKRRNGSGRRY